MRHGLEAPQNFALAFSRCICARLEIGPRFPSFSTLRVQRFTTGCRTRIRLTRALTGGVAADAGLEGKEDFWNGKTKYAT